MKIETNNIHHISIRAEEIVKMLRHWYSIDIRPEKIKQIVCWSTLGPVDKLDTEIFSLEIEEFK